MSSSSGPDIITNGLVLSLDASDKKSYSGSGTIWYDRSGNGKNGSLLNGTTFNNDSRGSLNFDGSNDYITCGSVLNFGATSSVGTILVWLKGFGSLLSNQRTGVGDVRHGWIQCYIDNQRLLLNIDAYGGPPYGEIFAAELSSTPFSGLSGQWNLCSIRINRPSNVYTIGINDYFTSYNRSFVVSNYFNFNIIDIGRFNNSTYGTTYFNGKIAQVNVYDRFLSNQEISQNFKATKSRFGL